MPSLHMLCGVPGCGKSTWIKHQFDREWFRKDTHVVISTDDLIQAKAEELGKTYDEIFKDSIDRAQKLADSKVLRAIEEGKNVIWDQTNTTVKSRRKKLAMFPEHYEKYAVVFDTPDENELRRRLNSRPGKTIPGHVVDSMIKGFEQPTTNEGFRNVLFVASNYADLIEV